MLLQASFCRAYPLSDVDSFTWTFLVGGAPREGFLDSPARMYARHVEDEARPAGSLLLRVEPVAYMNKICAEARRGEVSLTVLGNAGAATLTVPVQECLGPMNRRWARVDLEQGQRWRPWNFPRLLQGRLSQFHHRLLSAM